MLLTTAAYLLLRAVVLHTVVTHSAPMKASTLFLTLPWIVLTYLKLLAWPVGLSPMYPSLLVHRAADPHFLWPFAVCAALSVGICFFLRHDKRRQLSEEALAEWKLLVLAGLWAILFMLPALYLPALQEDAFVQDRYLYVPSIGLAIVAGLAITRVGREGAKLLGMPWSQIAIAAACAALMVYGIERELYIWRDNPALFTRAVERSPDNKIARHDLAAALIDAGRYDEGIALLRQLLGDDPNDYVDNNNLAQAYLKKGDRADAETYLTKSCQSHPTTGCLYQLGAMRFNLGRIDVAEQAFSEAIALDPSAQGYHYAEGLALERLGKLAAALEAFQKELALDPDNQQAKIEIGRLTGH